MVSPPASRLAAGRAPRSSARARPCRRCARAARRPRRRCGAASAAAASSSGLPASAASASRARQGMVATPPSAMRACRTTPSVHVERDRRRGQREFVGLPVADLQVERAPRPRPGRDREAGDQVARRQRGLDVGRRPGRPVQLREGDRARARRARRSRPWRRARSAPGRNRRDRWRCSRSLAPSTACWRLTPSSAAQPEPGLRLLQADQDVSRK